jgi:hypothetical protein
MLMLAFLFVVYIYILRRVNDSSIEELELYLHANSFLKISNMLQFDSEWNLVKSFLMKKNKYIKVP